MTGANRDRDFDYAAVFQSMQEGFALCEAIWDEDGHLVDYTVVEMNPALRAMLGVGEEAVGTRLRDGPASDPRWLAVCEYALLHGQPIAFEFHNRHLGRWHEIRLSRIAPGRMTQFFFDITDRKEAEARQGELFDELNHRVKNNLAMVAGLLEIQARNAPPAARAHLMKAVDRVHSVAAVHQNLYNGGRAREVAFGDYVRDLCERLSRSMLEDSGSTLAVSAEDVTIPADQAIPFGMIINELVTNAVKHAYPAGTSGRIEVAVARSGETLQVSVADHGAGVTPESRRVEDGKGLGMKLVLALARQLGGKVQIHRQAGTRVEIRAPVTFV